MRKNHFFISASLIVLLLIILLPTPAGLTVEGKKSLAVFAMAFILWATNALPLSITGILVISLIPLLGIMKHSLTFALFGNQAIFFILGAFIIATGIMKSGLSKRMALLMLAHFDRGPRRLIFGILLTSALMTLIMPSHAVAALMFPLIATITDALRLKPMESDFGAAIFLAMAYGSAIGSIGTLLGGARTPLAIAILEENSNVTVSFFEWTRAVIPLVFILLIAAIFVITRYFKMDAPHIHRAKEKLKEEIAEIGEVTPLEKKMTIILIVTLFLWIFFGQRLGIAVISLLASVSLFIMQCVQWEDVHNYVNWGVILMYGGAIVIAKTVEQTGAAAWLVETIVLRGTQLSPFVVLVFFAVLAKIITEAISNVACVAILLPVALSICKVYTINPVIMLYFVTVNAGLAFVLPMGTPGNAIAYSAGYYEVPTIVKPGLLINLLSLVFFILMTMIYWPFIGLVFL
ncbi:MAG: SLC13 family permease [bacterium]